MRVLVTGAAGFIGAALSARLLDRGDEVVGLDNLNDYYDPRLKRARLARLRPNPAFRFRQGDIADRSFVERLYREVSPARTVHLAAQAGVRYSLENPHAYVESNVTGFMNVLDACRTSGTEHLVYASTSSVYGGNTRLPFSEGDNVDHPLSLYAATKKANELMAHTYCHLHGLPATGLRFFTVYGPWGRPDMALFKFTERILAGRPIQVYNHGRHKRDFTYIDDIVEGITQVLDRPPGGHPDRSSESPDPATSAAPYRILNIGHGEPVDLLVYIETLERCLGRSAQKELLPMQPGDVQDTLADTSRLAEATGFRPATSIATGIARFVEWYLDYYDVVPDGKVNGAPG